MWRAEGGLGLGDTWVPSEGVVAGGLYAWADHLSCMPLRASGARVGRGASQLARENGMERIPRGKHFKSPWGVCRGWSRGTVDSVCISSDCPMLFISSLDL